MVNSSKTSENLLTQKLKSALWIASPAEEAKEAKEAKLARSKICTEAAVREGAKASAIACVVSTVLTLVAVRTIPWAKANINYTGQALIITSATVASFGFTADQTILECARRNSQYNNTMKSV